MYLWANRSIDQVRTWPSLEGDPEVIARGFTTIRRILAEQPSPSPQHPPGLSRSV